MRWTSIEAYHSVLPSLARRRKRVFFYLLDMVNALNENPTAQELKRFIEVQPRTEPEDADSCWKRLSELRDDKNMIHEGPTRTCRVKGKEVITWVPGPAPGTQLGQRRIRPRVLSRVRMLLGFNRKVTFNSACHIMGMSAKGLKPEWDQVQRELNGKDKRTWEQLEFDGEKEDDDC